MLSMWHFIKDLKKCESQKIFYSLSCLLTNIVTGYHLSSLTNWSRLSVIQHQTTFRRRSTVFSRATARLKTWRWRQPSRLQHLAPCQYCTNCKLRSQQIPQSVCLSPQCQHRPTFPVSLASHSSRKARHDASTSRLLRITSTGLVLKHKLIYSLSYFTFCFCRSNFLNPNYDN